MMWAIRIFVCLVVCGPYLSCDGTSFNDYLHEEHSYLQEVDRLFYTYYYNKAPHLHADEPYLSLNQNEQHNGPIPSPDWSPDLSTSDEFFEATAESDALFPILFDDFATEVDNYRPRDDGSGGHMHLEEHEVTFESDYASSGDSEGTVQFTTPEDDEVECGDCGSGDSSNDDTTLGSLFVQTTSIPVETTTSVYLQCGALFKSEISSCIKLSLSLQMLLYGMGINSQTGYYNVSSNNYYLSHLFLNCFSTIYTPPRCLATDGDDSILDVVTHGIIVFANKKNNGHIDEVIDEKNSFNCFHTHLFLLRTCIASRLDLHQLQTLVLIVTEKAGDVREQDCRAFQEVRDCLVMSMNRCKDSTSVVLVEDAFKTTMRGINTCSRQYVGGAKEVTSLGAVFTLAISILIARF